MNYNSRLLLTYLRRQSRPIKKILNISSESLQLPDRYHITQLDPHYGKKMSLRDIKEVPMQSFDFVYCRNPSYIFGMTYDTYLSIASTAHSGMILNVSPIAVILNNLHINHLVWTNSTDVANTLCVAEYSTNKLGTVNVGRWDQLCLNRPYLMYDWYTWNNPTEFAIKLYMQTTDYNTNAEYFDLINGAINLSADNTNKKIINR